MLTISEAAERLQTTPRALRYREQLGLLPSVRLEPGTHRRYDHVALQAAVLGRQIERRYGVGPTEVAFALRVLVDPEVRADLRRFGEQLAVLTPLPLAALAFDQTKAQRLLERAS